LKHIPPDTNWKNKAQLKLWQNQMDEWERQNPKTFMQDNPMGFSFLILGIGIVSSITLSWNGFNIFPIPEILGALFGYFGYQEKEVSQNRWSGKRNAFAKNAQDFIRQNKVIKIKVRLLDFSDK